MCFLMRICLYSETHGDFSQFPQFNIVFQTRVELLLLATHFRHAFYLGNMENIVKY